MSFPGIGEKTVNEIIKEQEAFTNLEFLNYCLFDKVEAPIKFRNIRQKFMEESKYKLREGVRAKFIRNIVNRVFVDWNNYLGDEYVGLMIVANNNAGKSLERIEDIFELKLSKFDNKKLYQLFEDINESVFKEDFINILYNKLGGDSVEMSKRLAFMYDIEVLGEEADDKEIKSWSKLLLVDEEKKLKKMDAKPRQLKFLYDLQESINYIKEEIEGGDKIDINLKFDVEEEDSYMGKTFDYNLIEDLEHSIIKKSSIDKIDLEEIRKSIINRLSEGTKIIDAEHWKPDIGQGTREGIITIENKRAQEVYKDLNKDGYITYIADFGNALHIGGGTIQGSGTQEDSLFQSYPELFLRLITAKTFYDENNKKLEEMATQPKEMRRAAKALVIDDSGLGCIRVEDLDKELERRINEIQESSREKVKDYSKKLVRRYGFKKIIKIDPRTDNEPGLIVINAPDLRFQSELMDKEISYKSEDKLTINKIKYIWNNMLKEYQAEIGKTIDRCLANQIGVALDNIVKGMKKDRKYAVVLGAVGCGFFQCDPNKVCEVFRKVLKEQGYAKKIDKIVFAIKDKSGYLVEVFKSLEEY